MFSCGGWVTAVAWSPSGSILAYAGEFGSVQWFLAFALLGKAMAFFYQLENLAFVCLTLCYVYMFCLCPGICFCFSRCLWIIVAFFLLSRQYGIVPAMF